MNFKIKPKHLFLILITALIILIILISLSFVTLSSGSYYFGKGDYVRAGKLYSISNVLSLGFNNRAKIRMSKSQEENTRQLSNNTQSSEQTLTTVSLDKISIIGKRVVNQYHSSSQDITLSAIVKNNSGIGIPSIKIKKITMYDGNNKKVAEKTDFGNEIFPLVSRGEYPFSFNLYFEKPKQIEVKDFSLELEIPSFEPNTRVVRLGVTNSIRASTETIDMDPVTYNFGYKVTITNDTEKIVGNIYRISFLKYRDFTLTRIGTACCPPVNFENKDEQDSQILNLNKASYTYSLNPKESREYEFKISTDPLLIDTPIDPANIELVTYFIGSIK